NYAEIAHNLKEQAPRCTLPVMGMEFPETARQELMTPTVSSAGPLRPAAAGCFFAPRAHHKESGGGGCLASVCIVDGTGAARGHWVNVDHDFSRALRDYCGRDCRKHHIAAPHALD